MAEHSVASAERITVTYAASQALLAAPLTPHFINLLKEQLPLRNLHWRPSQSTLDAVAARAAQQGKPPYASSSVVPGSTIRTIQTLDVAFKPLTDEIRRWRGDPGYFEQPGTAGLLDRPFVHLYLVVCEDSEHYRTTVRNEIRSWLSSLSFFHAKQAPPPSSVGTPTIPSSSRSSLGLGSFRSATPPVRSDTPPTTASATATGTNSGPNTPTNQGVPNKITSYPIPTGPTEPEYLIVLITPPEGAGVTGLGAPGSAGAEAKTGMGRFMNKSKGNVLDKARADFNTSKRERVVQLSRLPPVPSVPQGRSGLHSMDPTIWAELLTKMREAASSTFTTTIEAQEEEIARCGVTRGQQGWDFCSYFLAKDSLARTLEAVGLKDDSVGQYEDLEIVFAQAMQNGAVSFAPVGGDDPNDDSLPLLDVSKKPYADLIRRREISLFDFRCYLFARKSALLGKMGRVAAVMREAPFFISAVGRMLRRNRRLSSQWVESWIFSAALDVVEQCQAWLIQRGAHSSMSTDDQLSPAFHSNKSELLDVARRQLDRIGIAAGHLPASEPFVFAAPDSSTSPADTNRERDLPPLPTEQVDALGAAVVLDQKRGPSRPEIQRAVESRELFDSHYLALCERILAGWNASSRKRDALHVRTIIATLNYLRGKHQAAYENLVPLTEAYAAAKFAVLEGHSLAMQLQCHAKLDKPRDRAWNTAALAALRVCVQSPIPKRSLEAEASKWTDPAYLCDQLRTASASLEREVPVSGFPIFSIKVQQAVAKLAETEDGSLLNVDVTSLLPCAQEFEDVRVCLVAAGGSTLWYTSSKTTLQSGTTNVTLFCPHPAHGVYTVDVTQIRFARLIFQYDHASTEPTVVRVPKDGAAPTVSVSLPQQIDLEQPRAIELTIFTGRNDVDRLEFSVNSAAAEGVNVVDHSGATIAAKVGIEPGSIDVAAAASVTLKELQKGSKTAVLLTLTQLPETGILDAIVSLTYTAKTSSHQHAIGKKRYLKVPVSVRTALPLGVNVQDFFRASHLLSKFTISAGGGGSIRLRPVSLTPDGKGGGTGQEFKIDSCGSEREACVTPRQPATYLFRISKAASNDGAATDAATATATRLRLSVHYRTLQEDAISCALRSFNKAVKMKNAYALQKGTPARRLMEEALVAYVRERLDLPAFSICGQVRTGTLDKDWWRREKKSWGDQCELTFSSLSALVQETLDSINTVSNVRYDAQKEEEEEEEEEVEEWQKLTIPVEVPSIDYVNAVTLTLAHDHASSSSSSNTLGGPVSAVVGQPLRLTVDISTSTAWSCSPSKLDADEEMVYDIVPDFESWLVDGLKRGTFPVVPRPNPTSLTKSLDGLKDTTFSVTVTIVPLQTGALALPSILVRPLSTIKPQPPLGANTIAHQQQQQQMPTCEMFTTNIAQRIQVIPAKTTKAFFVPSSIITSAATTTTTGGGLGTTTKRFSGNEGLLTQGQRNSWKRSGNTNSMTGIGFDRFRSTWQSSSSSSASQQFGQAHAWQAHV